MTGLDKDNLKKQLEEVQKQAEAFKQQLKEKEEEAASYKKRLSDIGLTSGDQSEDILQNVTASEWVHNMFLFEHQLDIDFHI